MSFININQTSFDHTFQSEVTFLSNSFFQADAIVSKNSKLDVKGSSNFDGAAEFKNTLSVDSTTTLADVNVTDITAQRLVVTSSASIAGLTTVNDLKVDGELKDGSGTFGSAGQVLSSDGTDLAWINTSDANVGSATNVGVNLDSTNSDQWLAFVGASSNNQPIRVNSTIRVNPGTSSIGVGVAPSTQLHIKQVSSTAPVLRVEATDTDPVLDLKSADDGTAKIKFSDNNDAAGSIVYDHGHNKMKFMIDTTTSFWISPNAHFRLFEAFEDGSGSAGTAGQVLSSTGSKTAWINTSDANVGSATNVGTNEDATNANQYVTFVENKTGNNPIRVDEGLKYNPSTNTLTVGTISATNFSGIPDSFPSGGIIIWSGAANALPTGWSLCDGTGGTPDLRNRFVVGASSGTGDTTYPGLSVNATGGSANATLVSHSHTVNSHTHDDGTLQADAHSHTFSATTGTESASHQHAINIPTTGDDHTHAHVMPGDDQLTFANGRAGWSNRSAGGYPYDANSSTNGSGQMWLTSDHRHIHSHTATGNSGNQSANHTHSFSGTSDQTTPGVSGSTGASSPATNSQGSSATNANLPPYFALCYIMKD